MPGGEVDAAFPAALGVYGRDQQIMAEQEFILCQPALMILRVIVEQRLHHRRAAGVRLMHGKGDVVLQGFAQQDEAG